MFPEFSPCSQLQPSTSQSPGGGAGGKNPSLLAPYTLPPTPSVLLPDSWAAHPALALQGHLAPSLHPLHPHPTPPQPHKRCHPCWQLPGLAPGLRPAALGHSPSFSTWPAHDPPPSLCPVCSGSCSLASGSACSYPDGDTPHRSPCEMGACPLSPKPLFIFAGFSGFRDGVRTTFLTLVSCRPLLVLGRTAPLDETRTCLLRVGFLFHDPKGGWRGPEHREAWRILNT